MEVRGTNMKKTTITMVMLLFTSILLIACSDKGDSPKDNKQDIDDERIDLGDNNTNELEDPELDEKGDDSSSDSSAGLFEITEDDQIDLKMGDTAIVQTSIGTYELTVDDAEIVGAELDGVSTELEQLIILDLTFKNVDDRTLNAEDLMSSLGITDILEGSNNHNSAEAYESIDDFEGELEPGEERKTQFIADVYTAEEYYFRQNPGVVAAGTSNDVMWTITAEEAEK